MCLNKLSSGFDMGDELLCLSEPTIFTAYEEAVLDLALKRGTEKSSLMGIQCDAARSIRKMMEVCWV